MILQVYVDDATMAVLRGVALQTGRTVEDLAESAVANEASRAMQMPPAPVVHPLHLGGVTIGLAEQPDGSMRVVP